MSELQYQYEVCSWRGTRTPSQPMNDAACPNCGSLMYPTVSGPVPRERSYGAANRGVLAGSGTWWLIAFLCLAGVLYFVVNQWKHPPLNDLPPVAREPARKLLAKMHAQMQARFEQTLNDTKSNDAQERYKAAERLPSIFSAAHSDSFLQPKAKSEKIKELRQEGLAKTLSALERLLNDEDEDVKAMARVSRKRLREMMERMEDAEAKKNP
ncbi:MAG: hypothetical protein ACFCD0_30335 [Gemmataceae bacterium]